MAESIIVNVKKRRLDTLKPYPHNPRAGDIDAIAASMESNGIFNVLVVDVRTDEVLAGNHRMHAMMQAGQTEAWCVHVQPRDDKHAAKINVADNRLSDIARWDDGLLASLLQSLDGDLLGTGYDEKALAKLLKDGGGDGSPQLGDLEYRVVVDCRDEAHQAELIAQFEADGLTVKALTS